MIAALPRSIRGSTKDGKPTQKPKVDLIGDNPPPYMGPAKPRLQTVVDGLDGPR